jgi:hypothetical protein
MPVFGEALDRLKTARLRSWISPPWLHGPIQQLFTIFLRFCQPIFLHMHERHCYTSH